MHSIVQPFVRKHTFNSNYVFYFVIAIRIEDWIILNFIRLF